MPRDYISKKTAILAGFDIPFHKKYTTFLDGENDRVVNIYMGNCIINNEKYNVSLIQRIMKKEVKFYLGKFQGPTSKEIEDWRFDLYLDRILMIVKDENEINLKDLETKVKELIAKE